MLLTVFIAKKHLNKELSDLWTLFLIVFPLPLYLFCIQEIWFHYLLFEIIEPYALNAVYLPLRRAAEKERQLLHNAEHPSSRNFVAKLVFQCSTLKSWQNPSFQTWPLADVLIKSFNNFGLNWWYFKIF